MKNIIKFITKRHAHIGDDVGSIGTWREGVVRAGPDDAASAFSAPVLGVSVLVAPTLCMSAM